MIRRRPPGGMDAIPLFSFSGAERPPPFFDILYKYPVMILIVFGLVLAIISVLMLIQAKKEENEAGEYSIVFENEEELEKCLRLLNANRITKIK